MPSGERVRLAPGSSSDNPGGCFLSAVSRARRIRAGRSHAEYMEATINDWAKVEAVALWLVRADPGYYNTVAKRACTT